MSGQDKMGETNRQAASKSGLPVSKPAGYLIDRHLLEVLVCPLTRQPLKFVAERNELVSKAARLAYPVRDGIPIMLADEARELGDDE